MSTQDDMRALPHSQESEEALLSSLLTWPKRVSEIRQILPSEALYMPKHRILYAALLEMDSAGTPIDGATVVTFLTDRGTLDSVGGAGEVMMVTSNLNVTDPQFYAATILEMWHRRQGIAACLELMQDAYAPNGGESSQEWSARLLSRAMALHGATMSAGTRKGAMMQEVGEARLAEVLTPELRKAGLKTGLPWLDQRTGGCLPGRLWVLSGGTSDGKSALAEQILLAVAAAGNAGVMYSLEMPNEELWERAACQEVSVRSGAWQTLHFSRDEMRDMTNFVKVQYPVRFYDDLHAWADIEASVRLEKAERDVRLVVIDYLQLCQGDKRAERSEREVAEMSGAAKRLAMSLKLTVLLLSQENDEGKLRESRAIGQDADVVLRILTDDADENLRYLLLAKMRGGVRNRKCRCQFEGQHFRWTALGEVDDRAAEPETNGRKSQNAWYDR
jgi:replicative DNA helicase